MPYKVTVERNTLRFAAAHFATFENTCEPLHGHNYSVEVILASETLPSAEVWRWSSAAFVFGVLVLVWPVYIRELRALGPQPDTGVSRVLVVGWGLGGLALIVHSANLFGWPLGPSFSTFYLGLWLALTVAGIAFVFLIYRLLR